MSITKANLATTLNTRLNRSETATDIASEIRGALTFCSKFANWNCLHTTVNAALTSGDQSIAHPANYKALDLIYMNDGTYDQKPLELIPFEIWQKRRHDESSANYDEPKRYAERGEAFYLDPIPDSGWTYYLRYWQKQAEKEKSENLAKSQTERQNDSTARLLEKYPPEKAPPGLDAQTVLQEGGQWLKLNKPQYVNAALQSADPAQEIYDLAIKYCPSLASKAATNQNSQFLNSLQTGRVPKTAEAGVGEAEVTELNKLMNMPDGDLLALAEKEEIS